MAREVRPTTAVTVLFVVIAAITGASVVSAEFFDSGGAADPETVTLEDGSELWPYTSKGPNYRERTLSINLVVYGDTDATERALREISLADWEPVEEDQQDIAPAEEFEVDGNRTTVAWGGASGATRYVYVDTVDDRALWLVESYQLHDGDYLGERQHLRGYEDPAEDEWTAIQAHDEHWDWFHLRHTVHSIEESQLAIEEDFFGRWYVDSVTRDRFANDASSDADGWVTIVDLDERATRLLIAGLLLGSIGVARTLERGTELWQDEDVRRTLRSLATIGLLVLLYLSIRFGAVGIERLFPGLRTNAIVIVFYPLLVLGLPVVAYLSTRQLDREQAFAAASLGFTVAIFLDYTLLGVTRLPLDTFVHRGALAVAIGLIAAGASQTAREPGVEHGYVRTGVLLWVVAVTIPLLQFV
ncbi:hypothetical protein ACFQL3_03065 [Natronoarchaeum sp. GCM10025321]|uniref:hypothetical protein n=1 Tax=Natronoarchaeum sp. GCM10025321 TaxID=3252684 RepID=UPI003608C950